MEKLFAGLFISSTVLLTACAAPSYQDTKEEHTSNISFTSHTDPFPKLELKLRGKTYSISSDMIDYATSAASVKTVFAIPANEEIVLTYKASEMANAHLAPVIKGSVNQNIGIQIDFEHQYKFNHCTADFAFTSDYNKSYEAFIEQSDGILCKVYIREVISSRGIGHNTYKQVKTVRPAS